jgi:hypothetical protein
MNLIREFTFIVFILRAFGLVAGRFREIYFQSKLFPGASFCL